MANSSLYALMVRYPSLDMWEGPSDPSVGEGPGHWERLPPTETRSHKGKAMSYA